MRRSRTLVPLLAASAIALSACGLGSTSVDLSSDCRSLSNQLDTWNQKVLEATTAAKTDQGTPDESTDNQDKATAQSNVDKLNQALKAHGWQPGCNNQGSTSASASATSAAASPSSDGTDQVVDHDGTTRTLPVVTDNGSSINGDSTTDPRTPASYADAKKEGPLKSWADLGRIMGSQQWYVDGLNVRATDSQFDWSKVQQFASATTFDARVITVHHENITDQQARDAVRPLIGADADKLPIYRFFGDIMNTRGFGKNTMEDFVDKRQMVRVELARIVYDKDGNPIGVDPRSGVQVDCFNLIWEYQKEQPVTSTTVAPEQPAQVTSAPRTESSGSHGSTAAHTSTSTRTSTSSSSAPPAPPATVTKDATQDSHSSDYRQSDTTGAMHSSGSAASTTSAAPSSIPEQQEQQHPVPPSGTATATVSKAGDPAGGTGFPSD